MATETVAARSAKAWDQARRQHWVLTWRDLHDLGFDESAIRHRLATGRLHRIHRGVYAVGDVMYDTTLSAIERAGSRSRILETLALVPRTYAVATVHRAENTDDRDRFGRIVAWLDAQAADVGLDPHGHGDGGHCAGEDVVW